MLKCEIVRTRFAKLALLKYLCAIELALDAEPAPDYFAASRLEIN